MSPTARSQRDGALEPRGPRFALLVATSALALASACSHEAKAAAGEKPADSSTFEAEVSASWEPFVSHSQRISPATDWDGSLDGLKTLWFDNGVKQGEGRFVKGRKQDAWTFWYENGARRWEGTYHDDLVHGVERSWYPNGALCYEGTSVEGKRHGEFHAFYEDGQPWWQGEYRLGVRQGPFQYWRRDGSPDKKVSGLYVDGKRVKAIAPDLAAQ